MKLTQSKQVTIFMSTIKLSVLLVTLSAASMFMGACDNQTDPTGKKALYDQGREYTYWFYQNDLSLLWEHCSELLKLRLGNDPANLAAYRQTIISAIGTETGDIAERGFFIEGLRVYERTANVTNLSVPVALDWMLDDDDAIMLFESRALEPEAPSAFLDYRTKTALALPFDGEWMVLWGGHTTRDNYHVTMSDQRFAYDFLVVSGGWHFTGDGSRNENYYCFGRSILAPGSGVVVSVVNTVPDNEPGINNWNEFLGNHVILDHGNGEYSFLCHLKQGSVTVRLGDQVTQGQLLGLCGNSGGSDLPHLHYHLQNTPVPVGGEGLPAQFLSYRANRSRVNRGEPTRWQLVENLQ